MLTFILAERNLHCCFQNICGTSKKKEIFLNISIILVIYLPVQLAFQTQNVTTASVVKGLESMTTNPVTSLAWVRSPEDALVV
jgi:hypothetical protein